MDLTLIDPRDATEEVDYPTYRVEVISSDRSRITTWRISRARDFQEVWAWAEAEKGAGSAVIHAEAPTDAGLTLLRLHGTPYSVGNPSGSIRP